MRTEPRYEAAYIVSPPPRDMPAGALSPGDPDMVAYNECKVSIHMMEETLARMRHHLAIIQQRIIDKTK